MSSSPSEIECPECGAIAVRQISGGIGLHFKGSGFYITDYGKDGKKPRAAEQPDGAKQDAGKGEAKESGKAEPAAAVTKAGSGEGSSAGGGASEKPAPASKSDKTSTSAKPKSE